MVMASASLALRLFKGITLSVGAGKARDMPNVEARA